MEVLMWLLPTGFLGSVLGWVAAGKRRRLELKRDEHSFYKELYNEVYERFNVILAENRKLYRAVGRLEKAVSRLGSCDYRGICPVVVELQRSKAVDAEDGAGDAAGRVGEAKR